MPLSPLALILKAGRAEHCARRHTINRAECAGGSQCALTSIVDIAGYLVDEVTDGEAWPLQEDIVDRRGPSGATDASTTLGWCELGHPCIDIEQQEDMT